jgi:acyl-coenzyme A synthetase/AMP-(fatty) acid ligase
MQPCPVGAIGEIYIGGDCLARGYINRAELTAERFIPNPFVPNARLYKTGDLGRYFADGNIEFLGRKDQQVKVRGFRIELGEIEAVLAEHPQVQECVAAVCGDGGEEKQLVAYVVPRSTPGVTSTGSSPVSARATSRLHGADGIRDACGIAAHRQWESGPQGASGADGGDVAAGGGGGRLNH